jgi:hypothetical protein
VPGAARRGHRLAIADTFAEATTDSFGYAVADRSLDAVPHDFWQRYFERVHAAGQAGQPPERVELGGALAHDPGDDRLRRVRYGNRVP